jgi:hypothetical protein
MSTYEGVTQGGFGDSLSSGAAFFTTDPSSIFVPSYGVGMKIRILSCAFALVGAMAFGSGATAMQSEPSVQPVKQDAPAKAKPGQDATQKAGTAQKTVDEKEGPGQAKKLPGGQKSAEAKQKEIAMKRQLATAESRYRIRSAKLARLAAIAEEKGDDAMAGKIAQLQAKNDGIREQKISQLRTRFGDEKVDAGLKRVDKIAGNRQAAASKVRQKAKSDRAQGKASAIKKSTGKQPAGKKAIGSNAKSVKGTVKKTNQKPLQKKKGAKKKGGDGQSPSKRGPKS